MIKKKFKPAFDGLVKGFRHPSVRLQFLLGLMAVIAGIVLKLSRSEWVIVIFAIAMVIASELFNTCIEQLCDLYTTEQNEAIGRIKDISAAAVLVSSIAALIAAIIILIQHLEG